MNKIILLIALFAFSCTKNGKGKYCWDCDCQTVVTGQQSKRDTCVEDPNYIPQFVDANNNDVNCFCTERR